MNVKELAEAKGVKLYKASANKGGEYHGPCPNPGCCKQNGFHVWPAQNSGNGSWWCRGCAKGGDNISFLMHFDGLTFKDAAVAVGRELNNGAYRKPTFADKVKKSVQSGSVVWSPAKTPERDCKNPAVWAEHAQKLVTAGHELLMQTPKYLARLAARGLDADACRRYLLGLVPVQSGKTATFRHRESWGLEPVSSENGKPKKLWIPRGIMIPFYAGGQIHRIKIRRADQDITPEFDLKYYALPGSGKGMMFLPGNPTHVVVVESELDGLLVYHLAGDLVSVLALGSASVRPDADTHAALERADKILVALDADKPGADAWKFWQTNYQQAARWPVPAAKDPGDAFKAGLDIRAWILAGLPPSARYSRQMEQAAAPAPARMPQPQPAAQNHVEKPERPAASESSIERLFRILASAPVKIEYSEARTRIIPYRRLGDTLMKEISNLIFFDADVSGFLASHPAEIISGSNFYAN